MNSEKVVLLSIKYLKKENLDKGLSLLLKALRVKERIINLVLLVLLLNQFLQSEPAILL